MGTGHPVRLTFRSLAVRKLANHPIAVLLTACLCVALVAPAAAPAAEPKKNVEEMERAFSREKDHRKRARVAMEILDLRLDAIRAYVTTGTMLEQSHPVLAAYAEALDRLDQSVHAAAHAGTSKRIEVGLRRHMKDLEHVRANVSAMERPLVEELSAKVVKLREAVLYSIMAPKK